MINPVHLHSYVIGPVLGALALPKAKEASQLLLLTAAQESRCGEFLHQIKGPARGIFQMEPATHDSLRDNYIAHRPDLSTSLFKLTPIFDASVLDYNLAYATAMARILYRPVKDPLPQFGDIEGMARYWKHHYNTLLGRGTVEEAMQSYKRLIEPYQAKIWRD